jgi:8-oxo-dGTP diphosphatase
VTKTIRAAGGLIIRRTPKGRIRVLVAHRPRYDDWSLPKGKVDKGETPAQAAVREVLEETGQRCRIVAPIGTTRYRIGRGIKEVDWYVMRPLPNSPGFKKNSEVDQVRWLSRNKALEILDYERDRDLVEDNDLKKLAQTGTLWLLRHATGGNRSKWEGDDMVRPLTKKGKRQSEAIAKSLRSAGIERIISSPYDRCIQTVHPLSKATGAKIEVHEALAEDPDLDATYALIHDLAGANAVLCTHGDVIPAAVNRLMWLGLTLDSRFYCSKGSIWEIRIDLGKFTTGHYIPPPKV